MPKDSQIHQALANLARFSPGETRSILSKSTVVTIPARWAPIAQATPADKVYLILSGELSVRDKDSEIGRVGPGELVGEQAFANNELRSATVVAETSVQALHFTAQAWKDLVTTCPRLAQAVTVTVANRH